MGKLKFKLNDRVLVQGGEAGTIAGIDTDATILPYLIALDNEKLSGKSCDNFILYCKEYNGNFNKYTSIWAHENDVDYLVKPETLSSTELKDVYVRRFPSGAVRSDDRGRERPSFISPYALKFLAQHFSANAAFFNSDDSAKNYFKGIKPIDVEDSLERHFLDFKFAMMPHKRDRNAIKKALVELMANCTMALHQIGMEEDGDYKEIYSQTEYIKK